MSALLLPRRKHHLRRRPHPREIRPRVRARADTLERGVHQAEQLQPAEALVAEGGEAVRLLRRIQVEAGGALQRRLGIA